MPERSGQLLAARPRRPGPSAWTLGALAIAALALLPVAAVAWLAARPGEPVWAHLWATTLPRYAANTAILMAGTGALAAAMGTGAAWLVVLHRFPGRGWLQWALLLPLAVPAYVAAYALVDLLDYAGPVQRTLRAVMGWKRPAEYWFPPVRSRGGAILVLSGAFYPYVYLLARAAFREQSGAAYEVARALGAGPWARLWRVGLPLARPAIAAGTAVVMMEVVADFGAVDFFAVQTLTTGIFSVWLQAGNLAGAAQLALCSLVVVAALLAVERAGRARGRTFAAARSLRPVEPEPLRGWRGWAATAACLVPVLGGFALPVAVLAWRARDLGAWTEPGLLGALGHSAAAGGAGAVLTVATALLVTYAARLSGSRAAVLLLPATSVGYAVPGAVLGIGILVPLAALDHRVADAVKGLSGYDPGLLLTGSAAALVYAYAVRFFAVAQGAADSALARVPPALPMAARSLGRGPGGALRDVHLPLLRASMGSALLLVFVDCVKELPATLLLRPFGYETLATRAHMRAGLEDLAGAAPAALSITALGLAATLLLARANR